MKIRRALAIILATIMLAAAFVGCTPEGGNTDPTKNVNTSDDDPFRGEDNIKLLVWGPDKAANLLKKQCDAFKAKYPDKKIDITVKNQGENDAATAVLNDAEAAADVFGFPSDQLNRLVNAGALKQVLDPDDIIANNSEGSVAASTLDGKLYAFPQTGDNGYMLVYDKRVVTDEDAKTIEGVVAACKKAGKKFIINAGDGFYSCMFTFTGGLKINGLTETEDGYIQKFNDYKKEDVVASMAAFGKLFQDNLTTIQSLDPAKIASGFSQNTLGAGIDGNWNTEADMTALGENYGVAKLPTININGEDKQIISMHGYKMLGCNKFSKYPEASQLLAAYLTSEECQIERAKEISWGPTNKVAAESDAVKNSAAITAILEQANNSVPQMNISDTFWTPMADLGNKLVTRGSKIDTATLTTLLDKTVKAIKDE